MAGDTTEAEARRIIALDKAIPPDAIEWHPSPEGNSPNERSILIIMDDRENKDAARSEADILSTIVRVMPFSQLASNTTSGLLQ